MSYEIVIKNTKKIEASLQSMGASGTGLYEKSLSIESKLDKKTLNSIRFIATIRNKLLHEDGFELSSKLLNDFISQCTNVNNILDENMTKKSQNYCQITNDNIKDKPYKKRFNLDKQPERVVNNNNSSSNVISILIIVIIIAYIAIK